jgi:hypothetical protein
VSEDVVRALTQQLRTSNEPEFVRIRELLYGRGVDPNTAVIACLFEDDVRYDFGVIVSRDGSVYQFGFDYLGRPERDGVFSEWKDITDGVGQSRWRDDVSVASSILGLP